MGWHSQRRQHPVHIPWPLHSRFGTQLLTSTCLTCSLSCRMSLVWLRCPPCSRQMCRGIVCPAFPSPSLSDEGNCCVNSPAPSPPCGKTAMCVTQTPRVSPAGLCCCCPGGSQYSKEAFTAVPSLSLPHPPPPPSYTDTIPHLPSKPLGNQIFASGSASGGANCLLLSQRALKKIPILVNYLE